MYRLLLIILLYSTVGMAQSVTFVIPDSLKTTSYDDLLNKHIKAYQDTIKSKVYLNTYYKKAILDDNDFKKAEALGYISYYLEGLEAKMEAINLAIHLAKKSENRDYLMVIYTLAGGYHLRQSSYDKALDFYFKSLTVAEEFQNQDYIYTNKHNIAIIKGDIGDYKESLKLFKECYYREVRMGDKSYLYDYISSCLYLSESFIRNKQLDSANFYLEKVLLKVNDTYSDIAEQALVYKSISNNKDIQEDYKKLSSSLNKIRNQGSSAHRTLVIGSYHAGLMSRKLDDEKPNNHFKEVDSLYQNNGIYIPEVRFSLENLIRHYKTKKNPKKQLQYVDKLLRFDSIYNKQRTALGAKIYTQYDTPVLLSEKEKLIKNLDKQNITLSYSAGLLLIFVILLSFLTVFLLKRNKKLKSKFNNIVTPPANDHRDTGEMNPTTERKMKRKELTISPKIVGEVLAGLSKFEKNKGYLNKNLTTSSVAKKIGTNSKYLSQIVNHYKEKTLTTYVNDLRINESIDLLQSDRKILNYTIQSIAEEVGFNNAESFSKAFFKHTELKPSYFIKQLKNK